MLEPAKIATLSLPFLHKRGLDVKPDDPRLVPAFASVRIRASTLEDAAERVDFYFRDPPVIDEASAKKFLVPAAAPHLAAIADLVASADPFLEQTLEASVNGWAESQGVAMKDFAQAARVALTGRGAAPGLFEIMAVLGRDVSVRRLREGQRRAAT
jgi:glutamyl-tRNA synthetase